MQGFGDTVRGARYEVMIRFCVVRRRSFPPHQPTTITVRVQGECGDVGRLAPKSGRQWGVPGCEGVC